MGCGNSSIKHNFQIHLFKLTETSHNEYTIKEVDNENFICSEKGFLTNYILFCKKKNFYEFFETEESIKECAFILLYDKRIKKDILTYNQASKYDPYIKIRKDDPDIIVKGYIINIKEKNISLTDLNTIDFAKDLNTQIIKITDRPADKDKGKDNLDTLEDIEQEVYEVDIEIKNGININITKELTAEIVENYLTRIENEKVVSLCIKNNNIINLDLFKKLIDKLIDLKTLQSFTFSDNHNSSGFDDGWSMMINLFNKNKSLRNINLAMSFLYEKYVGSLFKALRGKKIYQLDVSSNFISLSGAKKIAEWLKRNRSIKQLSLQQNTMNEFKKEGSDLIITQLIKYHNLISLDLSNMALTGFGLKLSELITTTKSLKDLKIKSTRMNLEDHKNISKAMCENNTVEYLGIGDNYPGLDEVYTIIAELIRKNKKLIQINLDKLQIGKKTLPIIFEAIEENKQLQKFSFNENNPKISLSTYIDFFEKREKLSYLSIVNREYKKLDNLEQIISKLKNSLGIFLKY